MDPVRIISGRATPLDRSDVDTDQIIPAEYLKRVTRTGFADGLFAAWRTDPAFVLNRPEHAGASILVAGRDFGTGSSREHAVWALLDAGFRVVVSARFGDIFRGNAGKAGLLAASVDDVTVEALWELAEARPDAQVTVDLEERTVRSADGSVSAGFAVDDHTRARLLQGLDDVATTLAAEADIAAYEARRPAWRPTTLPVRTSS